MTDLRTAAQQALEVLLKSHTCPLLPDDCEEAITALRAALAQQAELSEGLGPLPPTIYVLARESDGYNPERLLSEAGYTEEHMRAYAAAAVALERDAQQAEPVEPVAKVIATAPKRIWLDLGFDPADEDITFDQLFEATWSQDNATGWGIEYVRADLVAPPQRKPLTEEEIEACRQQGYAHAGLCAPFDFNKAARAVERAHGITDPQVADRLARHGIPMPGDPK